MTVWGLQLVGDYRYSGAVVGDRKFSFVRNGDELQRVSEVFADRNAELLWEAPMPMTLEILDLLKHEQPSIAQGWRDLGLPGMADFDQHQYWASALNGMR